MASEQLESNARALIHELAQGCSSGGSIGSFSCVSYDTAWVSMIQKKESGKELIWRFPECFQYLLNIQQEDGGWTQYSQASDVDSILNGLAALFALKKHEKDILNCPLPSDINSRIANATSFLQNRLNKWNVEGSDQVGFEVLIPTLLRLLEEEGVHFADFPELPTLMSLNRKQMEKFKPQALYGNIKHTSIHSTEALIGRLDFDKISHHVVSGSLMASPAATASYLIHSSKWDKRAEEYLLDVATKASGNGSGGIPSAYPTPIFELTWVISTLLLANFELETLGLQSLDIIGDFLEQHLTAQQGLLGFAPQILPDADDTAKAILSLNLLGRSASPTQIIREFETKSHFKTYTTERNPSFSANCNVLTALLYTPDPSIYINQISKAASFLCESWWEGSVKDKWNMSPQYSMMLLSQAFVRLLRLWDSGILGGLPNALVSHQLPVTLFQILVRTILAQETNGSWGQESHEITAYSLLTLVSLSPLPWVTGLSVEIQASIDSSRKFLSQATNQIFQPDSIWTEKVSYSSSTLCQAYCLAAMNIKVSTESWKDPVLDLATILVKALQKFLAFFSSLPLFSETPRWLLKASLTEGYLFLSKLKRHSRDIFPKVNKPEEKYLDYIPFTWTASNYLREEPLSANLLWDMMVISMLNYQADEYMETVVGKFFEHDLEPVRDIIRSLCATPNPLTNGSRKRTFDQIEENPVDGIISEHPTPPEEPCNKNSGSHPEDVRHVLGAFTKYVLTHPKVALSSPHDKTRLRHELQTFLLAHVTHISDNTRFSRQVNHLSGQTVPFLDPKRSFFDWVHTTSAEHTSCAYSFAFISCLTGMGGKDCFQGMQTKYLAKDLCTHLAVMCRQYNDFGSVVRDREEFNLNSVNFPEFHEEIASPLQPGQLVQIDEVKEKETRLKAELLEIAEYERSCLMLAVKMIEEKVEKRVMGVLKLFVDVTDLYGQIYVARDIGIQVQWKKTGSIS